ncbi:MAG: hypothetical protein NTY53_12055 [Kiritimatiellaeota bacterium]|nr:hypothetical protein [Kiritimatiellota bacterium]
MLVQLEQVQPGFRELGLARLVPGPEPLVFRERVRVPVQPEPARPEFREPG